MLSTSAIMQTTVNIGKLRRGIRYTFLDIHGHTFRATLDTYQPSNGISKQAIRLRNVEGLDGFLCSPISHIQSVRAFALPNSIPHFPYLIPEVNMTINQYF